MLKSLFHFEALKPPRDMSICRAESRLSPRREGSGTVIPGCQMVLSVRFPELTTSIPSPPRSLQARTLAGSWVVISGGYGSPNMAYKCGYPGYTPINSSP